MQIKGLLQKNIKISLLIFFLIFFNVFYVVFVNAQACPSNSVFSDTQATLVGEVSNTGGDSNVRVWFEWGRTFSLANTTPIQYLNVTYTPYRFCYTITNLTPCTTYYYRAVAQNSAGTNYGEIRSFTTSCYRSTPSSFPSLNVSCYASPNPAQIGSLVTFYSSVSGGTGVYSYNWSGDCVSSSNICQKVFYTPGTYYVYLNVYSGSESKSASCSVNVVSQSQVVPTQSVQNQKPIAEISYSPKTITPGTLVTFSAEKSYDPDGNIIFYEWKINDEIVSTRPQFSRALSSGTYRIKLTVLDDKGSTSSKELIISVGRTQFITQTVTKTVTRTVRVPVSKPETTPKTTVISGQPSAGYIDISIDEIIEAKICDKRDLNITLINNNKTPKKILFTVNGEVKKWFKPRARIVEILPNDVSSINWRIEIPCDVEEGTYYGTIIANINGMKKDFPLNIEVKKSTNIFAPLAAFMGGIFGNISLAWLLILILIIINIIMWYYLFTRSKEKVKIE